VSANSGRLGLDRANSALELVGRVSIGVVDGLDRELGATISTHETINSIDTSPTRASTGSVVVQTLAVVQTRNNQPRRRMAVNNSDIGSEA